MRLAVRDQSRLNLGISPDETAPVLLLDDIRLRGDEVLQIRADVLARWIVGLLAASADALAEEGARRRKKGQN